MFEKHPSKADKRGANLSKQKHYTKNYHEIHKEKCLVKCECPDQVVCVSLIIHWGCTLDNNPLQQEIVDEIAARVEQSPDVDVLWGVHALVIVEHIVTLGFTHKEHSYCSQEESS